MRYFLETAIISPHNQLIVSPSWQHYGFINYIMELIETILLALCLNITCPTNETVNLVKNEFRLSEGTPFQKMLAFRMLERELKGKHLTIATVQNGALSYAIRENNTWVGGGAAFELIKILQQKYEFNYSVIVPEENSLGSANSGIFGLLYNNQADVGVAFLPMTAVYWNYAEFATTLDVGEWVVVLKRPHASATGSGLMAPFTLNVWLLILISLLAVGPIMYLITSSQSKFIKDRKIKSISLPECMWFVYGALLKQGTVISPVSDSSRLVFATWWIFITILTAFYTANLTAFLTLSEFTLPIKNPRDIATKRFAWVSVSGSVIEEASNNNREELFNVLKGSQSKFVNEDDGNILKTWVTQRNYLYIAERPNVDILLYEDYINKSRSLVPEYRRCTYAVTPWSVFKSPRTFAYSKKFRYGPLFDLTLRNLVEAGLVKHFLTWQLPNAKICPLNLGNKERRLKNRDLLLTYYIVGVGFGIAIFIFFVEICIRILSKTKIKQRRGHGRNDLNFGHVVPPPPPYNALLFYPFPNSPNGKKVVVNGRDYWLVKSEGGTNTTLVPVRTPSALLFQYTH